MSVSVVPPQEGSLCDWLEPALREIAGQDPLGLQTITTDRILPALLPGVLALSRRARYFSIYAFLLRRYEKNAGRASNEGLDDFVRHREFELGVAANLCKRCEAESVVGNRAIRPLVAQTPAEYPRRLSIRTVLGGYGLYYRSPMEELGLVVPAGRGQVDDQVTPVDLLAPPARAQRLADSFQRAVADTRWYREWMHGVDPIPAAVLEELSEVACLCRLDEHPEEREAIRDALLTSPFEERAEPTGKRRAAFALILSLMEGTPEVAHSNDRFRDALVRAFYEDSSGTSSRATAAAQWAAAAMRDSLQDALSSIWHDFCRAGLQVQPFEGLTRAELRELVREVLVGHAGVELGGIPIATSPDGRLQDWVPRVKVATQDLGWQELCALAIDADDALTGLAVLVALIERLPSPHDTTPAWVEVALVDGDHQAGLLGMARLFGGRLGIASTVGELMQWVVDTFVVAVHETVAMSKLPESTFRFSWEQGRLRFVDNGVWRFEASGLRRDALAYIAYDLGWWAHGQDGTPTVTDDGREVIGAVFAA